MFNITELHVFLIQEDEGSQPKDGIRRSTPNQRKPEGASKMKRKKKKEKKKKKEADKREAIR